uniref:Rho-GAP domain-containing protein n=1 Tax=Seriola lalandi dorsalis TaxID=1841481 RepID=A0A3B4WZ74_SERLL
MNSSFSKTRGEFENDGNPDLNKDLYLQDIHCVSSLCKAYFRELPNPLLTYQLYDKFAVSSTDAQTFHTISPASCLFMELIERDELSFHIDSNTCLCCRRLWPSSWRRRGVSSERRKSLPSPSAESNQDEGFFKSVPSHPCPSFGNISPGDGPIAIRPYHAIIEGTDK